MKKFRIIAAICWVILWAPFYLFAQDKGPVIDEIVAVVGNNLILQSDIENELQQYAAQGMVPNENTRCLILEELLFQKLLVHQADLDSVTVSDAQVDGELDQRMRYYISQAGSEQKLEELMGKPIGQLKADFREDLRAVLLAKTMQGKITGDLKVTPSEVRSYFAEFPKDSLPFIDSEIEMCQIVRKAPDNPEEKKLVKEKLEKLRERVLAGEDFATLAVLYSEDGSSANGGELGYKYRNELVPEFSAAGFGLKGKDVSPVIESMFGYHIIQMIDRKGEQANMRHILMMPKVSSLDLMKASQKLDSIKVEIESGAIGFEAAAAKYSDDAESKNNRGNVVNPQTGATRFQIDELDPALFFIVDKMKVGEVSSPLKFTTSDGKTAYRLIYLKTRTTPHKANLKDDYQRIQAIALAQKQNKTIETWIKKKKATTYIKIDQRLTTCPFKYEWLDSATSNK
jgi:peptidyl-prolyl cis-trans isomerase SurA